MNDLISVIVPIYNVEKYLKECVDSIINQNYTNIEILLIDDGSTDNSGNLADGYKLNDNRVIVFHKKNGGLSDARNYGIKCSKGKYLCFVDSDDVLASDYLSSMYENIIKYKTSISACGMCHLYSNGIKKEYNFQGIDKLFQGDEAQIYLNVLGYYNVSCCNKLFDRKLFKNEIFPVGKKSEDWFIMYKLIEHSKSIYYNSDSKYYYRQRDGSITKNTSANLDAIEAAKNVYNYFINNDKVIPYASQSLIFSIIGVYNYELYKNIKSKKKYNKEINMAKKKVTYSKLSFSRKIQLFLFLYFRKFYSFLFKIYNRLRNTNFK